MDQKYMNEIRELANRFLESAEEFESDSYNETEARNDFINPFFINLGWDVLNTRNVPQYLREVKHEAVVPVEEGGQSRKKKPDYSFNLGKETKYYVEAKKPSVDLLNNAEAALQIRRYGWNGNVKVSILTNFRQFAVYDCTIPPQEGDGSHVARVAFYDIQNIDDWIDEFESKFSRNSVVSGLFDKNFDNPGQNPMRMSFDQFFLEQIRKWRNNLAKSIVLDNPSISSDTLNVAVQRILNRVLFLRSCEDRDMEEYKALLQVQNFEQLSQVFKNADRKYDSGLFQYIKTLDFSISDDVLISLFKDLYYPNSPYDFDIIDPFIIGQIYELFLTERLTNTDGVVTIDSTTEKVESRGIVITPRVIVDSIVDGVLDAEDPNSFRADHLNIRVADICCGSGIFLLAAYESLMARRLMALSSPNMVDESVSSGKVYDVDGTGSYELSFIEKREILLNCIFGVDIDDLAIEVSKFSLLLHLLDGTSPEEIDSYCRTHRRRVLPNLDSNLRVGNSLIDSKYRTFDPSIDEKPQLLSTIKMFDWDSEFDGPFDYIVGNPPYIRVQKIVKYSKSEYDYYCNPVSNYCTSVSKPLDEYYLFIERALSLIKDSGSIGFIVSSKFMKIKAGAPLRELLSNRRMVSKIVDFGVNPIFKKKSNYTCLLFLNPEGENFEYSDASDMSAFYDDSMPTTILSKDSLNSSPWIFKERDPIFGDGFSTSSPLKSICNIYVGLQTSADKIFIIDVEKEDADFAYFHSDGVLYSVEKAILRPCILDVTLEKYHVITSNKHMIFPYRIEDGRAKIYEIDEMKSKFPETFHYLSDHYETLSKRSISGKNPPWYAFGRSQSLTKFTGAECLVCKVLSKEPCYVYENNAIAFTGGGNGPYYGIRPKDDVPESIFYIQAILNWKRMDEIVKVSSSTFRDNYYSHGKQYVEDIPIHRIDFTDYRQKDIHDGIVSRVRKMMNLANEMDSEAIPSKKESFQKAIDAIDSEISDLLESLYSSSGDLK